MFEAAALSAAVNNAAGYTAIECHEVEIRDDQVWVYSTWYDGCRDVCTTKLYEDAFETLVEVLATVAKRHRGSTH